MALSAPFCPLLNSLSPDQSGRWLVGAVGIEPRSVTEKMEVVDSTIRQNRQGKRPVEHLTEGCRIAVFSLWLSLVDCSCGTAGQCHLSPIVGGPVAALALVPLIVREGWEAVRPTLQLWVLLALPLVLLVEVHPAGVHTFAVNSKRN